MTLRCLVTVPTVTAIPRDSITNSWHFGESVAVNPALCLTITTELAKFYETWKTYRSLHMDWVNASVKWYRLEDPIPRAPILESSLGLTTTKAANSAAHELALCLSYQGDKQSGVPSARIRGRIYLGPFGTVAHDGIKARPDNGLIAAVVAGASAFSTTSDGSTSWGWVVHSTVDPAPSANVDVTKGWVDDEWDIQRRRGTAPSARTLWT